MIVDISNSNKNYDNLGNKGKFLVLMRENGFNVPSGIILSSDIYDKFILSNGLDIAQSCGTVTGYQ